MANDIPQNLKYTPIGVEGVVEVNAHLVGGSLIDSLRKAFTVDRLMEQGDYYMDRSLNLLEKHLQLMLLRDQIAIQNPFMEARNLKHRLHSNDFNGSAFQRFFRAREYKRLSRDVYKIVKLASDRIRENPLISQLAEATQAHGGEPGSGPGINPVASSPRNPFTDSHAISTLTDVDVNDLDRVEMSTYQEQGTNEAAVVIDLVAQDESVQHVVATFSTEAFSGDRTDREEASQPIASAPPAISLHRDDGSSPRFIPTSLPDVSDRRADEQAETCTLDSFAPTEPMTSEGNRPHPVVRASVPPFDGDTYTRSCTRRRPL